MDDGLYPEIEPYERAKLEREGHSLYYELSGNPDGPTALYVHGGPGGGDLTAGTSFLIQPITGLSSSTSGVPVRAFPM